MPDLGLSTKSSLQSHESKWKEDIYYIIRLKTFVIVNHIFRIFILSIVALTSLFACRDYDFDDSKTDSRDNVIGAYMSLTFSTASKNDRITRSGSSSAVDGNGVPEDYNENPMPLHWAEWEGNDVIDKVYVYIFNGVGEDASYETTKVLAGSEFQISGDTYTLKEPFLSTVGQKRVFVLVNLNQRLIAKINTKATAGCTAKDFRDFLQSSGWSDSSFPTVPTSRVSQTRADEFVTKVSGKDAIVMTGEPIDVEITEQMKETVKNSTTINTATVNVERVVAKVIVTIDKNFKLHETDLAKVRTGAEGEDAPYKSACMHFKDSESDVSPKAYISDITWTVVQGASDLYFLKKPSEDTETFEYNAQAHEELPMEETTVRGKELKNGEDEWKNEEFWTGVVPQYANFSDFYDYSGLWKKEGNSTIPYGIDIQSAQPYVTETEGEAETETNNLKAEVAGLHSEYLLPTYAGSAALNQRGNTAYILIRARAHPLRYATIKYATEEEKEEGEENDTLMVAAGDDGFQELSTFYFDPISNRFGDSPGALMKNEFSGNPETIMKYTDGYMYYFLLPNATKPNDKNTATVSPILRNQFYHIQIKKAFDMGYPWNPLVPYPKGTLPSEDPIIVNPQNPNPRPEDANLENKLGKVQQMQTGIHPHTNINLWLHRYEAYDNDDVKNEYLNKFTRSSHQSRTNQSCALGQGLNVTVSPKRK